MIITEENIVYQILDTVRASELNSDEVTDERQVRAYLQVHRARIIQKYTLDGLTVQDICFQRATATRTSDVGLQESTFSIPPIIQLPGYKGVRVSSSGFSPIAIVSDEEYYLAKKHLLNKYHPKGTIDHGTMTIWAGDVHEHVQFDGDAMQAVVDQIKNEDLNFSAILSNPDDGIGYDWTTSQYPLPEEALDELKQRVLRQEFNVILSTKSDQVPNMKNDTLRYHDQGKVNQ